jgi:hypothetical protein
LLFGQNPYDGMVGYDNIGEALMTTFTVRAHLNRMPIEKNTVRARATVASCVLYTSSAACALGAVFDLGRLDERDAHDHGRRGGLRCRVLHRVGALARFPALPDCCLTGCVLTIRTHVVLASCGRRTV